MQIVIDIDEKYYTDIKNSERCGNYSVLYALDAIRNGTPLPKGHGRLIDISDIEPMSYTVDGGDYYDNYKAIDWEDIENAPTIIEAESEDNKDGKV